MSELKMSDLDGALEHHGVKGMKWGRRKTPVSSAARTKKLEKKLSRLNGQRIFDGAGLSGWAAEKGAKNPSTSAKRRIAARGAVEVTAILGGAAVLIKASQLRNPKNAVVGAGILAGAAVFTRIDEIGSVRQYEKSVKIHDELSAIRKADRKH